MLPQPRLQNAVTETERQYTRPGLYSSRSGTPAIDPYSTQTSDKSGAKGSNRQTSAMQPSFAPVLQPKHQRPVSCEFGTSGWAASQHNTSEHMVLHMPRRLSLERPPANAAASRASTTAQQTLRQNSSLQAAIPRRPASVQRNQSAKRPSSQQRQQPAHTHAASE